MLKNIKVKVSTPNNTNPYRKGTFKQLLMEWALEQGEFTRDQFLQAVKDLKQEHEVTSKMPDDILSKAWWNEFKNKHKVFVDAQ